MGGGPPLRAARRRDVDRRAAGGQEPGPLRLRLKWECEKFPETADEMINQFKVQAFRAEEQALRAEDPDDGDDEPNDGDDDSDPSGDVRR
jgi:hypothetical protein